MAPTTARRVRRFLIDFSSGPVQCRSCGLAMRPTEDIPNGWPVTTIPYGRAGECKRCATPAKTEDTPTGEAHDAAEPIPFPTEAAALTPKVTLRRRPHRRFDYRPSQESLCFCCGHPINPTTGECRCSD